MEVENEMERALGVVQEESNQINTTNSTSSDSVANPHSLKGGEIEEDEIDQLEDDSAMNDSEAANLLNVIASGSMIASGSGLPLSGGYPATPNPLPAGYNKDLPICQNCSTQTTPLWRRSHDSTQVLCNACALFFKMKGRPRPISLKTDVIKQRNRSKGKSTSKDRLGSSAVAGSSAGGSGSSASSTNGGASGGGSKKARGNSTSRTREEGKSNGKSATGGSEMDDEDVDFEESQLHQQHQDLMNGGSVRKARKVGAIPYPPNMYPNGVNPYPYPYPYQPPPPLQSQHPLAHSHPHQHHQPYPPPRERSRSTSTTRRAPSADGRSSYAAGQVRGVKGESSNASSSSSAMTNANSTSSSSDNRIPYPYPPPPPGSYQTPGGPLPPPHESYYPYYPGYPYPGQPYYPPPPPGSYLPHPSHYHGSISTSSNIKHAQSDSRSQSPSGLTNSGRSTNQNTGVENSPRSSVSPPLQNPSSSSSSTVTSASISTSSHPYPPPIGYYPHPHHPAYNHSPLSSSTAASRPSDNSRPNSLQRRSILPDDLEKVTLAPINSHSRAGSAGGGGGDDSDSGIIPGRIVLPSIGSVTPTALLSGAGSPLHIPSTSNGGALHPIQRHTALFETRFPPSTSTTSSNQLPSLSNSTFSNPPYSRANSDTVDRSRHSDRLDFDEVEEEDLDPDQLSHSQTRDRTTRGDSVVSSNSAASASSSSEGRGVRGEMEDIASPEITSATLPWGISGSGAFSGSGSVGDERRGRSERRYGDDSVSYASIAEESSEKSMSNNGINVLGGGGRGRDSSLGGRMVGVENGFEELRVVDRSRSTGGGGGNDYSNNNIASPRGVSSSSGGGGNHHGNGTDSSRSRSSGGNNGGQEERGRGGFNTSSRSNSGGNGNGNNNRSGSTSRALSTSRNSNGGSNNSNGVINQNRTSSNGSSTGRLSSIDEVTRLKTKISELTFLNSLMQSRLGQLEKPGKVPIAPLGGTTSGSQSRDEPEDSAMDESGDGNEMREEQGESNSNGKTAEDEELERYGVTALNLNPEAKAGLLQFFRSQPQHSIVATGGISDGNN